MTVGTQMQQAVVGIESAIATMKTFSLQTEDEQAKQDYKNIAKTLEGTLGTLKGRQQFIEQQEPQYKQE